MPAEPCLGIVDWGIGGVGLLTHLDRLAPGLPVLYWSDAGVTPYGRMGADELAGRLTSVVAALARRGATEVVLACNAASTVADRLNTAVPVEGIIGHGVASVPDDAVCVAVVGGRRTIAAGHYRRGLARPGRTVVSRVAQPLSAHIEAGRTGSPRFQADLDRIIAPLRQADALVLACTHYPRPRAGSRRHYRTPDWSTRPRSLAAAVAARYPRLRQPGPAPAISSPPGIRRRCGAAPRTPGARC